MSDAIGCMRLNHEGRDFDFYCFNNAVSPNVCGEVLSGAAYPIAGFVDGIKTIVDIGANVGAAAVYFSLVYKDAKIFAFEPGKAAFDILKMNADGRKAVRAFHFGLFNRDCVQKLHHGATDSVTASIVPNATTTDDAEEIELRDARTALTTLGISQIDILKIDTEGCERHILASLGDLALAAKVIYLEFHSEADRLEFDRLLLPTHGLAAAKMWTPHRGELCYVARKCYTDKDYNADALHIPL
jgi:FkbM family methyltransferase